MFILLILCLIVILIIYFLVFRKKPYKIGNEYGIYKKLFSKHIIIKDLVIEKDRSYFIDKKLNDDQLNDLIYYLLIPGNNENEKISTIVLKHLDFIQMPDLIENEKKISNYYGFIDALHELTGKNDINVLTMTKKEMIDKYIKH